MKDALEKEVEGLKKEIDALEKAHLEEKDALEKSGDMYMVIFLFRSRCR